MYKLLLSRGHIRNFWNNILQDPYNPRPDLKNPDDFIAEIEKGDFKIGGATVVLADSITTQEKAMSGSPRSDSALMKLAQFMRLQHANSMPEIRDDDTRTNRRTGHTVAQAKRAAIKRKNKSRHKAACRK